MSRFKRNSISEIERDAILALSDLRDSRIDQINETIEELIKEKRDLVARFSGTQLALQFKTTSASITHITKGRKRDKLEELK